MKKFLQTIMIICVICFSICGCSFEEEIKPTKFVEVNEVNVSIESENKFIIETYNVLLENINMDNDSIYLLASEHGDATYSKNFNRSTYNEYKHKIESDIGYVFIQLEFYLQINYNNKILPYTIKISEYYYTKTNNNKIILYTDKKCTNEANFNLDIKNIHYSTGDIYNDSYTINLNIYVKEAD